MKIFLRIITVLVAFVLILSPLIFTVGATLILPDPYEKTFVGELGDKYDRLMNADKEKIVVLGGSSVAFGIRSDIIAEYTDMEVVNFGLYAALGTKLMLDLSRPGINSGDIVIITPELDAQTFSLYFNADTTLKALGGRFDMFMPIAAKNKVSMICKLWDYAKEKLDYFKKGLKNSEAGYLNPDGVYNSDNFNEWGDLDYERVENIMPSYYDTNNRINPSPDIIDGEFIDYLNDYIAYCNRRGATVYFNFCPMNEMGFVEGADANDLSALADYLGDVLDCEILGSPERSVLGAGYFYDTNFHLNEAGAIKYTAELTEDLLFALDSPRAVNVDIPAEPLLPKFDSFLDVYDENEIYFTFTELPNGAYAITGLTELGKAQSELTVPVAYNQRKVLEIRAGALSGMTATKLTLTRDTSIRTLADGSFEGVTTLRDLWIYYPTAENILPPNRFPENLLGQLTVHVPAESNYNADYFWSERGLTFAHDANLD